MKSDLVFRTVKSCCAGWLSAVLMFMPIHAAEAPANYQTVLSKAEDVAGQYRQLPEDSAKRESLREKVRGLVEQSFDLRQMEQANRLEQLRKQLAEAEKSMKQRHAIRDRIIKRKAEDLLDRQSAEWQATATSKSEAFETIAAGSSASSNAIRPVSAVSIAGDPLMNLNAQVRMPITGVPFNGSGLPSFEETYGILQHAKNCVQGIASLESKLAGGRAKQNANQRLTPDQQKMLESNLKLYADALSEKRFQLRLQHEFLRGNVEELRADWELSNRMLEPLSKKLKRAHNAHSSGLMPMAELESIKAELLSQESKVSKAWSRVARYDKIYSHWKQIAGDHFDELGENPEFESPEE